MEMVKLTAKLRDAVPVCFLVEGKEIKRYRHIDIPDELKKLEYQGFKFDVPTTGTITFKISFAPGVLPEEFPKERERRTRSSKDAHVVMVGEAPAAAPSEEADIVGAANIEVSNKVTQETAALIVIQEASAVEILENTTLPEVIEESAASYVEIQPNVEARLEANVEPKAKEATPAKKTAAKHKNVPTATKIGKE